MAMTLERRSLCNGGPGPDQQARIPAPRLLHAQRARLRAAPHRGLSGRPGTRRTARELLVSRDSPYQAQPHCPPPFPLSRSLSLSLSHTHTHTHTLSLYLFVSVSGLPQ